MEEERDAQGTNKTRDPRVRVRARGIQLDRCFLLSLEREIERERESPDDVM